MKRRFSLGLSCLGFALLISLFLSWKSWVGAAIPGCGPGAGCHEVLASRWGNLFGIPVGLFGAMAYAFVMVAVLRLWPRAVLLGGLLILGGGLWFTGVQLFILRQFCPWCCATHLVASFGAILCLISVPGVLSHLRHHWLGPEVMVALVAVIGFAILQSIVAPKERIQTVQTSGRLEQQDGVLSLHDGQFSLDTRGLPRIGLPDTAGTTTAVALTDYTCPYCRALHQTLQDPELANQLEVVLLPAFRDEKARNLHRIMLSVWKLEPDYFNELQEELINEQIAAEPSVVMAKVMAHFKGDFHQEAWQHGGWVDDLLRQAASLLAANDALLTVSSLPQLMIGDEILVGEPRLETIRALLQADPEAEAEIAATAVKETGNEANVAAASEPSELAKVGDARIEFEETNLKLPEVVKGEKATGTFVFTNTGSSPLEIQKIKTSCGCTSVAGWQQTVAPGEKGSFKVSFDSGRFWGKVTKTIDVTTNITAANNAKNGVVRVTIEGDVWTPVKFSRTTAAFGSLMIGQTPKPISIDITVSEEKPLNIGVPLATNPAFKTELKTIEVGRRYSLLVSVPEFKPGYEQGRIKIPLGHPRLAEIELAASIRITDPIVVTPATVQFPTRSSAAKLLRTFTINTYDPALKELVIEDLKIVGSDALTVSLKPRTSKRYAHVVVTFPGTYDSSVIAGKDIVVSFKTNHPKFPTMRVPVTVIGLPVKPIAPAVKR